MYTQFYLPTASSASRYGDDVKDNWDEGLLLEDFTFQNQNYRKSMEAYHAIHDSN